MLKLRETRLNDCRNIYKHMKRDFPANERPPYLAVRKNFKDGVYDGFFLEDDTDAGYAIIVAPDSMEYALMVFFAVLPEYRSKGYGGRFLELLNNRYSGRVILIEVEDPKAAKTIELRETALRRIQFYERNGYSLLTGVSAKIFGVDMLIMANTCKHINDAREIIRKLYLPTLRTEKLLKFIDISE